MFLLIDNYDSFTYNLWHYLGELGAEVIVKRNDAVTVAEVLAMKPEGVVISPGPSVPETAGQIQCDERSESGGQDQARRHGWSARAARSPSGSATTSAFWLSCRART